MHFKWEVFLSYLYCVREPFSNIPPCRTSGCRWVGGTGTPAAPASSAACAASAWSAASSCSAPGCRSAAPSAPPPSQPIRAREPGHVTTCRPIRGQHCLRRHGPGLGAAEAAAAAEAAVEVAEVEDMNPSLQDMAAMEAVLEDMIPDLQDPSLPLRPSSATAR